MRLGFLLSYNNSSTQTVCFIVKDLVIYPSPTPQVNLMEKSRLNTCSKVGLHSLATQSGMPAIARSASFGSLFESQNLGLHPRFPESESAFY